MSRFDVIVVGAGHNGMAAALRLQRAGKKVLVLEEKSVVGGASKTEYPFPKAPTQPASTGAYLLGPMPPEIPEELGIASELFAHAERRDPHYFLPTRDGRYLFFSSDDEQTRCDIRRFFSEQDMRAYDAMQTELAQLRSDLSESWLLPPLTLEATAEKYVRPELQKHFINLCRGSVYDYLCRFRFASQLLFVMFAITDGVSGVDTDIHMAGTGNNFLVHNMCRIPRSGGTWMRVRGGMGTVTRILRDALLKGGTEIRTGAPVAEIHTVEDYAEGVILKDGTKIYAETVVVNADPFRLLQMIPEVDNIDPVYRERIESLRTPGSTMKLNLCLSGVPRFTCCTAPLGQCEGTIHLIPDTEHPLRLVEENHAEAKAGRLPSRPAIEWYFDQNLRDENGNFSSALFVPGVPYVLEGTDWETEIDRFSDGLLSLCDEFAPGTSALVVDRFALSPPGIKEHFGITGGHIHHVPNTFGFKDRLPYRTPYWGLYCAGAACHPGGSVTAACGFIAAGEVLREMANVC